MNRDHPLALDVSSRLAACVLAGVLSIAVQPRSAAAAGAQPAPGARILVVPFENTQHDPRLYWLSE
ncbi:MAG: hypothetical protein ABJC89_25940, partial [Acidobacteriota bacterium]